MLQIRTPKKLGFLWGQTLLLWMKDRLFMRKLLNRTHFRRSSTKDQGWQWFWTTKSANEKDTVAVGGEGYDRLAGVLNGYFASQGIPDWEPIKEGEDFYAPYPYVLQKISDDHYVVTKFSDDNLETNEETKEDNGD